jgi:hypothetical protein
MSNSRWLLLSLALILGTMLTLPPMASSLGGIVAGLCVNAFAAGILFRGMVDGRRRLREKADVLFDASVEDLVKVHRLGGEAGADECGRRFDGDRRSG